MRTQFALLGRLAVSALLAAPSVAFAQQDASGHWTGSIKLPQIEVAIDVDLLQSAGVWSGDITIPQQGARDQKFSAVKVEGRQITFTIPNVPGTPTFNGTLSSDGSKIEGTYTQGAVSATFALTRGADAARATDDALAGFDAEVEKAMKGLLVPGMAVGIVRDGKVVFQKGYGFADVAAQRPVTPQTIFAIGSATKAFTTFAMAKLVEDGKMEWDKPAVTYLPGLDLHDEYASAHVTPRDMVTHRSGLPRHDLAWYNNSTLTGEALFARLDDFKPNRELRQTFQYNNIMYVMSGHLVSRITGKPWEQSIRELVLEPLAMRATNFDVDDSQKVADHALPYGEGSECRTTGPRATSCADTRKLQFRDISNVGPAGSINSNITDMLKWAALHAGDGTVEGKRLIAKGLLDELHSPQMVIGGMSPESMISPASYGLGWFIDTYRGHYRVQHGGNIDGFSALVSFFPHDRTGIVVLTNKNGTQLPELTVRHLADRLFELKSRDWYGEAIARRQTQLRQARESEQRSRAERVANTKPAHGLSDYAGDYEHPGYGTLSVTAATGQTGRLVMRFNAIETPLEHWHYEVFNGGENPLDGTFRNFKIQFETGLDGQVSGVRATMDANVDPVVFVRAADRQLRDVAYIARFIGNYQQGSGSTAVVQQKGDRLVLNIPGQAPYELIPERNNTFALKGMNGFRVQFAVDGSGKTTEAVFKQPNGIFPAKRVQ
jgi:CubicO group peptidase (beta-lactamase class C family)